MAEPDQPSEPRERGGVTAPQASTFVWVIVGLRAIMELGIVLGLAYWGYQTGSGGLARIGLAIGAPLVGFGFWGLVDFHQLGRAAEPLRLVQELVVSGLVAVAVWNAGQPILGLLMGLLSILYHALVYASGGRLLRRRQQTT